MLRTLICLLAVTGMRVGEALRLTSGEIDRDTAVITIRRTKFGKSRHVPVTADTIDALAACMEVRDETLPSPSCANVFVSGLGTPVAYSHFCLTFRRAITTAGIGNPAPVLRPRIHDLRHSFAVRTLLDRHRAGLDATLQGCFTERLVRQRQASPATVASYRDSLRLLLGFVADRSGKAPSALRFENHPASTSACDANVPHSRVSRLRRRKQPAQRSRYRAA